MGKLLKSIKSLAQNYKTTIPMSLEELELKPSRLANSLALHRKDRKPYQYEEVILLKQNSTYFTFQELRHLLPTYNKTERKVNIGQVTSNNVIKLLRSQYLQSWWVTECPKLNKEN